MHEETKLGAEIAGFFTKIWSWILPLLFGMIGKYGYELSIGKKYKWYEWAGIGMVNMFFGYCGILIALNAGFTDYFIALIGSISTWLGQNIAFWLTANFRKRMDGIIDVLFRSKSDKS